MHEGGKVEIRKLPRADHGVASRVWPSAISRSGCVKLVSFARSPVRRNKKAVRCLGSACLCWQWLAASSFSSGSSCENGSTRVARCAPIVCDLKTPPPSSASFSGQCVREERRSSQERAFHSQVAQVGVQLEVACTVCLARRENLALACLLCRKKEREAKTVSGEHKAEEQQRSPFSLGL